MIFFRPVLFKIACSEIVRLCLIAGHCAKLQAIINKAASDPRAADKLWLVVLDDDTIMRYAKVMVVTSHVTFMLTRDTQWSEIFWGLRLVSK